MPDPSDRRLPWGMAFAAAMFLTALATSQQYTSALFEGLETDWIRTLRREALNWYAWAAVAPLVLQWGRGSRGSPPGPA